MRLPHAPKSGFGQFNHPVLMEDEIQARVEDKPISRRRRRNQGWRHRRTFVHDNGMIELTEAVGQAYSAGLDTVIQVLKEKMARRGVPVNALRRGKMEEASHDSVRETLTLHIGIESEDARKIVKQIKQLGVKVQSQIMDNKVRVTGKKLDELQAVIAYLKEHGPEYPLQFINFT